MNGSGGLRTVWHLAVSGGVPRRSLMVALVVGTILNLINQGEVLFEPLPVDWTKLVLTYLVPYCVATYGAVTARLAISRSGPPR